MAKQGAVAKNSVSNDAQSLIIEPFTVMVRLEGTADLLFHRWSDDAVAEKAKAAKGSKAKKTDDIESYLYRDEKGHICMPARYIQRAIVEAGRFHQDPRSTRKMAKDLVQAGVIGGPILSPILVNGKPTKEYDYEDRQRVVIQRSAITRTRPAFNTGWQVEFEIASLLPEYISQEFLHRLTTDAGKFIGLADFRPTYGRFVVVSWNLLK